MRRAINKLSLLFLLSLFCFVPAANAQIDQWGYWNNGVSESWWFSAEDFTKGEADSAIEKWNEVGSQLKGADPNSWYGDYFRGDETHGIFFRVSDTNFVMVRVDKCAARVMSLSYGTVRFTSTQFQLQPQFAKSAKSQHAHDTASFAFDFVGVKWRKTLMLVAETEMPDFGDYVAGLGKYNYSDFRYWLGNEFFNKLGPAYSIENSDQPQVPQGYEHFLKEPITATITAVKSRTVKKNYSYENPDGTGASNFEPVSLTTVTIDAGSAHGLKRGMFLRVVRPNENESVRLLQVGKFSSTGVIARDLIDGHEKFFDGDTEQLRPYPRIQSGWRLTTSHLR
jgi:hypothetical protein